MGLIITTPSIDSKQWHSFIKVLDSHISIFSNFLRRNSLIQMKRGEAQSFSLCVHICGNQKIRKLNR